MRARKFGHAFVSVNKEPPTTTPMLQILTSNVKLTLASSPGPASLFVAHTVTSASHPPELATPDDTDTDAFFSSQWISDGYLTVSTLPRIGEGQYLGAEGAGGQARERWGTCDNPRKNNIQHREGHD